jgi:hypothetical protein
MDLLEKARSFHESTRAFWFVRREVHRQLSDEEAASEDDQDDRRFRVAEARTAYDYFLPGPRSPPPVVPGHHLAPQGSRFVPENRYVLSEH